MFEIKAGLKHLDYAGDILLAWLMLVEHMEADKENLCGIRVKNGMLLAAHVANRKGIAFVHL